MSIRDPDELGHWKHPEAEAEFRALIDELAAEGWSPRPASSTVETSFGDVVVHHIDQGEQGAPAVLFPGFGAPALMYRPELVKAIRDRTVHLVETIGDVGSSVQSAPIRDADHEATWITDVLDGLGIDAAHMVGTSFGGWLVLNLALRRPDRVRSVVAVEPVWRPLGIRTMAKGIPVLAAAAAPAPIRRWAGERLHQPLLWDRRLRRVGRLAYTRFVNGHPRPQFLTDDELARIDAPVAVLLGASSEITRPEVVRRRLAEVLPDANVDVVPSAGHSLAFEHPQHVGDRIDAFLRDVEGWE